MTSEDLRDLMRKELSVVARAQIVKKYNIRVNVNQELTQILVLPEGTLKTPEERERENHLKDIQYHAQEMRGGLLAFTSVLGLSDPKAAKDIAKAGNAAIDIYSNVATMSTIGLSATGVGTVAAAAVVLISLTQQGGESIEQTLYDALQQVLKNQVIIINKLNAIDFKVDLLRAQLADIKEILEMNHEEQRRQFDAIKIRLGAMQSDLADFVGAAAQENHAIVWRRNTAGSGGI